MPEMREAPGCGALTFVINVRINQVIKPKADIRAIIRVRRLISGAPAFERDQTHPVPFCGEP